MAKKAKKISVKELYVKSITMLAARACCELLDRNRTEISNIARLFNQDHGKVREDFEKEMIRSLTG